MIKWLIKHVRYANTKQQSNMYFLRSHCIIAHRRSHGNVNHKLDQQNSLNSMHYYASSYKLRQETSFNKKKILNVKIIICSHFHIKKEHVVNVFFINNQAFVILARKHIVTNAEIYRAPKKNAQSAIS